MLTVEDLSASFVIAQILGLVSLVAYSISTQQNDQKKMLWWLTVHNALYAAQYFALGAFSGCIASVVPIVRNLVYRKYKKAVPAWIIAIFCFATLSLGLVFYDGPISLLPIIHTVVYTIFLGLGNLTDFRFIQAFSCSMTFIYNITVGAYAGVIVVFIEFTSAVIGIIRFDSQKIKQIFSKKNKHKRS